MKVIYKNVKTILNKSKIAGVNYTLNPYVGCKFACKYCYASYMSNFVGEDVKDWGNFIYVKQNAKELLLKELTKLEKKGETPTIMIASATDAWQDIEKTEKLTRGILEVFIQSNFEGRLNCLTKSALIVRDIDLFKKIKRLNVGMSITGIDDKISSYFEPYASPISERFSAIEILNKEGIETSVFIAPLLPYYINHLNELEDLFKKIRDIGTKYVIYDLLNFYGNVLERFKKCFENSPKGRKLYIETADDPDYQRKMQEIVNSLMSKYGFKHIDERTKEYFDNKKKYFKKINNLDFILQNFINNV